jgi:hypothetical protein
MFSFVEGNVPALATVCSLEILERRIPSAKGLLHIFPNKPLIFS